MGPRADDPKLNLSGALWQLSRKAADMPSPALHRHIVRTWIEWHIQDCQVSRVLVVETDLETCPDAANFQPSVFDDFLTGVVDAVLTAGQAPPVLFRNRSRASRPAHLLDLRSWRRIWRWFATVSRQRSRSAHPLAIDHLPRWDPRANSRGTRWPCYAEWCRALDLKPRPNDLAGGLFMSNVLQPISIAKRENRYRLAIRHVAAYRYSERVTFRRHRLMFRPRDTHSLRLLDASLSIQPSPQHIRWAYDTFGNSVAYASLATSNQTFSKSPAKLAFWFTRRPGRRPCSWHQPCATRSPTRQ